MSAWWWRLHDLKCVFSGGSSSIEFMDGIIYSVRYFEMLKINLESITEDKHDYYCWFQQDNANPHVADHTNCYFTELVVPVIQWTACITDLIYIDNLWEILYRDVYTSLHQFFYRDVLREAIVSSWDLIDLEALVILNELVQLRINEALSTN